MSLNRPWFTYIVQCSDGTFYTGVTPDLEIRLRRHDEGRGAKYTRGRGPVVLMWAKLFPSKGIAMREEIRVKRLSRPEKEKLIPWYGTDPVLRKENPLLQAFYKVYSYIPEGCSVPYSLEKLYAASDTIKQCCAEFSWAIPTEEALLELKSLGPLVEMGAGTGYWAHLLRQIRADVIAYDMFTSSSIGFNPWHSSGKTFTRVLDGSPPVLKNHQDRALFLCWPPSASPMARECLDNWKGKTLAYVGDFEGITGDSNFYSALRSQFDMIKEVAIPRWYGAEDSLTIWSRK